MKDFFVENQLVKIMGQAKPTVKRAARVGFYVGFLPGLVCGCLFYAGLALINVLYPKIGWYQIDLITFGGEVLIFALCAIFCAKMAIKDMENSLDSTLSEAKEPEKKVGQDGL
jgi:hypothetical protein